MRLPRYPTEQEWEEFAQRGPGTRMYKGKMTLFYNGEILRDVENGESLVYTWEERYYWEVIIVLPGVEVIPENTFQYCRYVETVIMAHTVREIEHHAFKHCTRLVFVMLSRSLECIGEGAFSYCKSLTSIFVPPSCREICTEAFEDCEKLIICSFPQHTRLGNNVFVNTELFQLSPFEDVDRFGHYTNHDEVNAWVRDINANHQEYALHRACCSFNPLLDTIYQIVQRNNGLQAFKAQNRIGITPSQYLEANPFGTKDVQKKVINRYILEMMGEIEA